jgi:hypothetical protein
MIRNRFWSAAADAAFSCDLPRRARPSAVLIIECVISFEWSSGYDRKSGVKPPQSKTLQGGDYGVGKIFGVGGAAQVARVVVAFAIDPVQRCFDASGGAALA